MEVLTIFADIPPEKIFTPKARRIFPKQNQFERRTSSDSDQFKSITIKKSTSIINDKSINLDKISLDEINKDFLEWNQNLDEEKCFNEINSILSNSTKDCSFDNQYKKINKIERPNCPIDKKYEFFENINIVDLIIFSGLSSIY